jgi:hypothetical protein
MIYDFGDVEVLRLMRAFNQIDVPKTRRIVLALVEAMARARDEIGKPEQRVDLPKLDA